MQTIKTLKKAPRSNPINWYPGHMLRAKKQLIQRLKQVDVVLELRDARIPIASVNPDFESILQQKKRMVLLNKAGLADAKISRQWLGFFKQNRMACHFIDVRQNRGVPQVLPLARELMEEKWMRFQKKGIRPPTLKLMVAGIPNVGKSSLINKLVKRHAAATGPHPGVTKHEEWIKLGKDTELLDTPGILWPRLDHPETAMALAVTGAIKDRIAGEERLCHFLIEFHSSHYPDVLREHYQLEDTSGDSERIMAAVAQKRGCLRSKGEIDFQRVARLILRDFRMGKLGKISFEKPPTSAKLIH